LCFRQSGAFQIGFDALTLIKNFLLGSGGRLCTTLERATHAPKDTASQTFKRSGSRYTRRKVGLIPSTLLSNILCKPFLASLRSFGQSFSPEPCDATTDKPTLYLVFNDVFDSAFCNGTAKLLIKTRCAGNTANKFTS
jgi:hypothetical protein